MLDNSPAVTYRKDRLNAIFVLIAAEGFVFPKNQFDNEANARIDVISITVCDFT